MRLSFLALLFISLAYAAPVCDEVKKVVAKDFGIPISEVRSNILSYAKLVFANQARPKKQVKPVVGSTTCDRVKRAISKEYSIPLDKICNECNYEDDFGVEPLQVVKLFEALQEEFKIKVPEENIGGFMIVERTCQWFENHVDEVSQQELR